MWPWQGSGSWFVTKHVKCLERERGDREMERARKNAEEAKRLGIE